MPRISILGCPVDSLDMDQTVRIIEKKINGKKKCHHVSVNAAKIVEMRKDDKYRNIIENCHIINADGMSIVWVSYIWGKPLPERVPGVDVFQRLVNVCSKKGYRPFFFGAEESIVRKTVERLRGKYPELDVAGYRNGYFSNDEESGIAEMIRDSRADMLFVAFSSPDKEKFLYKWMPVMNIPFCMGVGGSFDIIAGKTRRAPEWMQKTGFEWFFRIIQEPKRMWKRYAETIPVFLWIVFKEFLRGR